MPQPPTPTVINPRRVPARHGANGGPPSAKPKLKKLRLAFILFGIGLLALISTVFGMMMALASDLPQLENKSEYRRAQNSVVLADETGARRPAELAKLTGNQNRVLVGSGDISPNIKNAVIAIEDRRFYQHNGVDYKGIARAFVQDLLRKRAAQGGSTITQQFVKNALAAQSNRSVFQKLREAALAYHLSRKWTKQKVLTQYLNTVYFGNGAYGVESAARTYFGADSAASAQQPAAVQQVAAGDLNVRAARDVTPAQAALLAGIISSPSLYDPIENPRAALDRRNLVLKRMLEQKMITAQEYRSSLSEPLPTNRTIAPPRPDSKQPYFTSWLTQQLVDRYRAPRVFSGGLTVRSTLDPQLQAAAENAIRSRLAGVGPSASLVAIENRTGEVKAMVGGSDFDRKPFNLATNGHRQPGSSIKAFTLVRALWDGISPATTFASRKKIFDVPGSGGEKFVANNYEGDYTGSATLATATARSDNSVFAELGLKVGTRRIAALMRRMGVQTPVSTNPAMTLGGLEEGVTPLEMAYAYSTIANKGVRVSGSLDSTGAGDGPVAIREVDGGGNFRQVNKRRAVRVFPEKVGDVAQSVLAGVVTSGTGKQAAIGEFAAGKTGTTENYGDAWFVGFNKDLTVAVWVGYPDRLQPMKTEFNGGPVAGGTFPAQIWRAFMMQWISIRDQRAAARGKPAGGSATDTAPATPVPAPAQGGTDTAPPAQTAPDSGQGGATPKASPAPKTPAPAPKPPPTPAPAPTPPAGGGGGGGGGVGQGGGAAPG